MRRILAVIAVLLCIGLFSSCQMGKSYLNADAFGEEFRVAYPELYLNRNCDHFFAYKNASKVSQDVDANLYHYTYCHWGHCDYEGHFEPHVFKKVWLYGEKTNSSPQMMENGYFYHWRGIVCSNCETRVNLYVLCETQESDCIPHETGCCQNLDWEELLRGTPYIIIDDPLRPWDSQS